jgi:hypothetical protein
VTRVDVSAVQPTCLEGSVTVDGEPAAYQCIRLERLPDQGGLRVSGSPMVVSLDGAGRFRCVLLPGRYRSLVLDSAPGTGDLAVPHSVELLPGQRQSLRLSVEHGHLQAGFRDGLGGVIAGADSIQLVRSGDRSLVCVLPATDGAGISALGRCETGDFVVRMLPQRLCTKEKRAAYRKVVTHPAALESEYLDVGRVTVAPGATTRCDIVVPDAWAR